ncbi:DNA-binding protein, partial [Streptococcus suis]
MDSRLLQMVDEFESALMDRALKVMHVVTDEKRRFPMELNKSQCAEMLLGTKDTGSFDARFNCHKDFPRIPNAREK